MDLQHPPKEVQCGVRPSVLWEKLAEQALQIVRYFQDKIYELNSRIC